MNELNANAPLPARQKQEIFETDDYESDVFDEPISGTTFHWTVYRCAARDCPEVIARQCKRLFQNYLLIIRGYMLNKEGVFIKSRRSSNRDSKHRVIKNEEIESLLTEIKYLEERMIKENDASELPSIIACVKAHMAFLKEVGNRSSKYQIPIPPDQNVLIKCAKCGRISKILGVS